MKTIRTILATLAVVLLGYGILALAAFKSQAALAQRTLYWVFNQSYFVTLVLGVAFLLIAVILTIATVAFRDAEDKEADFEEDKDEDDEEDAADIKLDDDVREYHRPERHLRSGRIVPNNEKPLIKLFESTEPVADSIDEPEEEYEADEAEEAEDESMEPVAITSSASNDDITRFCIYCGGRVTGDAVFCPKCGKRL